MTTDIQAEIKTETPSKKRAMHIEEVLKKIGLGRSSLYLMVNEGRFPKPVKYNRAVRWIDQEVEEWLENHMRARDAGQDGKDRT